MELLDNDEAYDFMSSATGSSDKKAMNSLLESVGLTNAQLAESSQSVRDINTERQQAQAEAVSVVQSGGAADAVLTEANQRAALLKQSKRVDLAAQLGVDTVGTGGILGQLANSQKEAILDYDFKRKNLQKAMDTKFSDGPIDYLIAQFQLDTLAKEADVAVAGVVGVKNAISAVQSDVTAFGVVTNATAKTITDTTIQATMQKLKAGVDKSVADLTVRNSQFNVEGIAALNSMSMQALNAKQTGYNVIKQEEQLDMARKQLALSTASFNLSAEERRDRIDTKRANQQELDNMVTTMRVGLAQAGMTGAEALPTSKIAQMLKMPQYESFYKSGMYAEALSTQTGKLSQVVGLSLPETARFMMNTNAPLNPVQNTTVRPFLMNAINTVQDPKNRIAFGLDEKSHPDDIARAAAKYMEKQVATMQSEINPKDGSNIYGAPEMSVIASVPAIQQSPFYQKVIKPQMQTGQFKEINPSTILGLGMQAIKDKTLTFDEVVTGHQALFGAVKEFNNVQKNFGALALPLQRGFNARIGNGFFAKMYDQTNAKDVGMMYSSSLLNIPGTSNRPFKDF